jgi:ribosomal protein S4E
MKSTTTSPQPPSSLAFRMVCCGDEKIGGWTGAVDTYLTYAVTTATNQIVEMIPFASRVQILIMKGYAVQ